MIQEGYGIMLIKWGGRKNRVNGPEKEVWEEYLGRNEGRETSGGGGYLGEVKIINIETEGLDEKITMDEL